MVSEQRTGIKTHFPELRNNKMIQLLHKYSCVCVCAADRARAAELVGLAFLGHSSGHRFPHAITAALPSASVRSKMLSSSAIMKPFISRVYQ